MNISGPMPLPKTTYLLSGQRRVKDDYVIATREYMPTDTSDFEHGIHYPTGDGKVQPLGQDQQWSGVAKITNRSISNVSLSYQAIVNSVEGRRSNYSFHQHPDGLTRQDTWSITHGLDITHALSPATFYNLGVRQNYLHYTDYVYSDFYDQRYDAAGPLQTDWARMGVYIQGVDLNRFEQKTNAFIVKGAVSSQMNSAPSSQDRRRGPVTQGLVRHSRLSRLHNRLPDPALSTSRPTSPGSQTYKPVLGAAYVQDQMEWSDLTVRLEGVWSTSMPAPRSPAISQIPQTPSPDAPESHPQDDDEKVSFAPRLGVAYPITDHSGIHFAYGRFYQLPGLGRHLLERELLDPGFASGEREQPVWRHGKP